MTPGFLRLFLAIAVPPDIRQEIGRAQGQLRRHAPPGAIRWTRPEQFHVTLKFLGDVPAAAVAALEKAAGETCANFPPLPMSAHGIGFFPGERQPRVLWAGAHDEAGQLPELHRQLSAALCWLGAVEKVERFSGHITLGRFKPGRHGALAGLMKRAATLRSLPFGEWQAGEVELVRSELDSAGAVHTVLATFPLKATDAPADGCSP